MIAETTFTIMLTSLIAAALIAQATPPTTQTITGQVNLVSPRIRETDGECFGTGGFRDVRGELPVVIKDGSGKILASGQTAAGKRPGGKYNDVTCVFAFVVPDVPKTDFYQIEVGRRGAIVYPAADLIKSDWKVNILLSAH
jgi:hypothetical protein